MMVEISGKSIEYIKQLEQYLSQYSKEELNQILAFGEKYKSEGEKMRDNFWKKWNNWNDETCCGKRVYGTDERRNFKILLMQYGESKEKFLKGLSPEEADIMKTFDGIMLEKFYKEYLYDRILFIGKRRYKDERLAFRGSSLDSWVAEIKHKIKPGIIVDIGNYSYGVEGIEILAKELKNYLQPGMSIRLGGQYCGVRGIEILAKERKDSLQPGMAIELTRNNIGLDGIEILARERKNNLQPGMCIYLTHNDIGDEGVKILAKEWKDSLQQGMSIWLMGNNIGDSGVNAIMDNLELKDGVEILLLNDDDNVSEKMKQNLGEWVDSWHKSGVNCNVVYI